MDWIGNQVQSARSRRAGSGRSAYRGGSSRKQSWSGTATQGSWGERSCSVTLERGGERGWIRDPQLPLWHSHDRYVSSIHFILHSPLPRFFILVVMRVVIPVFMIPTGTHVGFVLLSRPKWWSMKVRTTGIGDERHRWFRRRRRHGSRVGLGRMVGVVGMWSCS